MSNLLLKPRFDLQRSRQEDSKSPTRRGRILGTGPTLRKLFHRTGLPGREKEMDFIRPKRKKFLVRKWYSPIHTTTRRKTLTRLYSETRSKEMIVRQLLGSLLVGRITEQGEEVLLRLAVEGRYNELVLETFKFSKVLSVSLLKARVNAILRYFGQKPFTQKELESLTFSTWVEETDFVDDSPSPKSYSGWRRNQNDQGSLRNMEEEEADPIQVPDPILFVMNRILIETVLSVGTLPPPREDMGSLMMALRRAETERFLKILKEELS